jgi:hypothetical protein
MAYGGFASLDVGCSMLDVRSAIKLVSALSLQLQNVVLKFLTSCG